jgi:hypothetical protein
MKSATHTGNTNQRWRWVTSETLLETITRQHMLLAYGFDIETMPQPCMNKLGHLAEYFAKKYQCLSSGINHHDAPPCSPLPSASIEASYLELLEEEKKVAKPSRQYRFRCNKMKCRMHPQCLNYLDQDLWILPGK